MQAVNGFIPVIHAVNEANYQRVHVPHLTPHRHVHSGMCIHSSNTFLS